jgi:hypothetical protein
MSENKLLSKVWGLWQPNLDGSSGKLTIGSENVEIEFDNITIYDYIDFINDLQQDLVQSRSLLERMNVLLTEETKDGYHN